MKKISVGLTRPSALEPNTIYVDLGRSHYYRRGGIQSDLIKAIAYSKTRFEYPEYDLDKPDAEPEIKRGVYAEFLEIIADRSISVFPLVLTPKERFDKTVTWHDFIAELKVLNEDPPICDKRLVEDGVDLIVRIKNAMGILQICQHAPPRRRKA